MLEMQKRVQQMNPGAYGSSPQTQTNKQETDCLQAMFKYHQTDMGGGKTVNLVNAQTHSTTQSQPAGHCSPGLDSVLGGMTSSTAVSVEHEHEDEDIREAISG